MNVSDQGPQNPTFLQRLCQSPVWKNSLLKVSIFNTKFFTVDIKKKFVLVFNHFTHKDCFS